MRPRDAVVCPQCGAVNRAAWGYCVRCQASLEKASPAAETAIVAAAPEPSRSEEQSLAAARAAAIVGLVAVLGGGVWTWRYAANAPPPRGPDPAVFALGREPRNLPAPLPPPSLPGQEDYERGRRLLAAGDVEGALASLASAVATAPENAEYHKTFGYVLWRAGRRDRALAEQAEAARLDSRLKVSYAQMLDAAERPADAIRVYEEVLLTDPESTSVREHLGHLLFRSGEYGKAAPFLQQAVQARPDDPVLQQELAYSLDQSGDRAKAEAVYRGVLARIPEAATTRVYLAHSLYRQGRPDEAIAALREGLSLSPHSPMLHRELGSLLEQAGQRDGAAAAYAEYTRLAPNAPDASDIAARAARLGTATAGGS